MLLDLKTHILNFPLLCYAYSRKGMWMSGFGEVIIILCVLMCGVERLEPSPLLGNFDGETGDF